MQNLERVPCVQVTKSNWLQAWPKIESSIGRAFFVAIDFVSSNAVSLDSKFYFRFPNLVCPTGVQWNRWPYAQSTKVSSCRTFSQESLSLTCLYFLSASPHLNRFHSWSPFLQRSQSKISNFVRNSQNQVGHFNRTVDIRNSRNIASFHSCVKRRLSQTGRPVGGRRRRRSGRGWNWGGRRS